MQPVSIAEKKAQFAERRKRQANPAKHPNSIENAGMIAFFEATACLTLLVLFAHLKRDNPGIFYRIWVFGWICLTLASFSELGFFFGYASGLHIVATGFGIAALVLFLASIVQLTLGQNRFFLPMIWLAIFMAVVVGDYL